MTSFVNPLLNSAMLEHFMFLLVRQCICFMSPNQELQDGPINFLPNLRKGKFVSKDLLRISNKGGRIYKLSFYISVVGWVGGIKGNFDHFSIGGKSKPLFGNSVIRLFLQTNHKFVF